jgi:hypothetical protein
MSNEQLSDDLNKRTKLYNFNQKNGNEIGESDSEETRLKNLKFLKQLTPAPLLS